MRFRFFFLIDLGKLLRLAFLILLLLVTTCSCSGVSARQASAAYIFRSILTQSEAAVQLEL